MLRGKHVLLGVTASIAAYKSAFLTRLLIKSGAEVRVILTPSAVDFVTPLTLATLSKNPVNLEYFDGKTGAWNSHIELAEWADYFIISPLSANTMAKMVQGICDNLLLAAFLSARCQIFFAPAMDLEMYQQKSVQDNIETMVSLGHILIPPAKGELASGLEGEGRMEEPEAIIEVLENWINRTRDFEGKKFLISAGPTQESLDPVRYITNHSSGKMGLAIAHEAMKRGAEVTLVHGPVNIRIPGMLNPIGVTTTEEMSKACIKEANKADVIIMSAAVSDYKPKSVSSSKIKKKAGESIKLELERTTDILSTLGNKKRKGQFLVGFALETNDEEKNAREKLKKKNLDMIVLNSMRDEGAGFKVDTNKISLIRKDKKTLNFPLKTKRDVARDILDAIKKDLK